MTSEEEVYDALKYRIDVSPITGTRRYHNSKGQLHREDGPAVVYSGGSCEWWQNGLRHRADGPAMVYADGTCEWWVHGVNYTEEEYHRQLKTLEHTV